MLLTDFSIISSGGHFVWRIGTISAIFVEDIMGNIHIRNYLKFGQLVQEERLIKEKNTLQACNILCQRIFSMQRKSF